MDYIFVFILGLVIGSFLNVCIYRIPMNESIIFPASHCTSCKHSLHVLDLIPVMSYLMLKGRCRYCENRISIRYPILELFNAILYLLIYYKFGIDILTLKYCMLVSLLIVISIIDYNTQNVYSITILVGVVISSLFILIQYILYDQSSFNFILGGIIGALIIGLVVFATKGMGEGDIEIAGICGLFIGYKIIFLSLFIAIIVGGIFAIGILLLKVKEAKDKIAFGPFIAIGTIISIMYGSELIEMYIKLLI
ncbi:MAG: prepilin peptidase [Clostridium butyricum]|nr:prepilin peptidase [Clostridium butyricum]